MRIDLAYDIPEELALGAPLPELLKAVKAIDTWTERQAEVLDYVYRYRIQAVLSDRRTTIEALRELDRHLAQVTNPVRRDALNALGKPYYDRWCAYRELLEGPIALLASAAPDRVMERQHARGIIDQVSRQPGIPQQVLIDVLGLGKPNATRILKLMDASGLIERHAVGRENHVYLGRRGEAHAPQPDVQRWGRLLCKSKAA
ncbi:MAG: helix-turn-helix transcriptional regulator [Gammaproteobacteria bacterium]